MNPEDSPRFYQALSAMGLMFSDTLAKPRQKLYWEVFAPKVSIEEWEYACHEAISRETFHKVPLPAAMMTYVYEWRMLQRRALEQAEAKAREEARLVARAERIALEASPEWQAAQAKQRAEDEAREREYQARVATFSREEKIARGLINPPDPRRWLPLEEDIVGAKPKRRGKLRKLIDPEREEARTDDAE